MRLGSRCSREPSVWAGPLTPRTRLSKQEETPSEILGPLAQLCTARLLAVDHSAAKPLTVTAELRLRRTFQELMDAKGWDAPDMMMERAQVIVDSPMQWTLFLPLVLKGAS